MEAERLLESSGSAPLALQPLLRRFVVIMLIVNQNSYLESEYVITAEINSKLF